MEKLDSKTTRKIQNTLTEILVYLDKFLLENEIEYFLVAGTALGARRHNGFIPWDDDIDLGMTYSNYLKFLEIAKTKLDDKYVLLHHSVEKNFPQLYAKVVLKDSVFLEYSSHDIDMPHGFFIDIFPYVAIPENDNEFDTWYRKVEKVIDLYTQKKCKRANYLKGNKIIKFVKKYGLICKHYLLQIIPDNHLINKFDKLTRMHENKGTTRYVSLFAKAYITNDELYPLKKIEFENYKFYAPNKIDAYLERSYGKTYMELPPVEKRITHKPLKIVFPEELKK